MATRFDPAFSVQFDLGRGQIAVRDGGDRVLVPVDALVALCDGADREVRKDFAHRLGTEAGRRVAERLGDTTGAGIEAVVEHIGGDLALMGLGSLAVERWGRALVVTIADSPFGARGDDLLVALLEGVFQRAFGRDASAVLLMRADAEARFLITSRAGAEKIRSWLSAGTAWGDALARFHSGAPS
jgi:hypothetical protein